MPSPNRGHVRRKLVLLAVVLLSFPFLVAQARTPVIKGSTLLVDTDDTCHLFMDDEDKGLVTADHSQKFKVDLGDHILKCTVEGIPDLVWRKVVSVKDSSQVAAVITLKALHLQYDQAVAKAKNQNNEAAAAAARQLQEAEAAQKEQAAAIAEIPQRAFEMVKGDWRGTFAWADNGGTEPIEYQFNAIQGGLIIADVNSRGRIFRYTFKPVSLNRLEGVNRVCIASQVKEYQKPGAPKDKDGWAECWGWKPKGPPVTYQEDSTITVTGDNHMVYKSWSGEVILTR